MKKLLLPFMALLLFSGVTLTESCKSKKKAETTTPDADASLRSSVNDVIRQYENVQAEVKDGVVTLKGTIKQADLQSLMSKVQELGPKQVKNELVII